MQVNRQAICFAVGPGQQLGKGASSCSAVQVRSVAAVRHATEGFCNTSRQPQESAAALAGQLEAEFASSGHCRREKAVLVEP